MQHVEQLPLILVDPLHVDIKHGVWVDSHASGLIQVLLQLYLVILQSHDSHMTSNAGRVTNLFHSEDFSQEAFTFRQREKPL